MTSYFAVMAIGMLIAFFGLFLLCRKPLEKGIEQVYELIGGSGFMLAILSFFAFLGSSYSPFMKW